MLSASRRFEKSSAVNSQRRWLSVATRRDVIRAAVKTVDANPVTVRTSCERRWPGELRSISDGNSNPSIFTSSGNTSQTESAFEDDFDFFGISKKTAQNDPWQNRKSTSQDPFGPLGNRCPRTSRSEDNVRSSSIKFAQRCLYIYLLLVLG
jgi:hypothetical protein